MKVFMVIAHEEPHQRSFLHALFNHTVEIFKKNKVQYLTLDLFANNFTGLPSLNDFVEKNPDLTHSDHAKEGNYNDEILRSQASVEWCTHLMVFTPLHWLGPSAALMGWWEKVFGEGWAYVNTEKGKKGFMESKKAMAVVTCGMQQSFFGPTAPHVTVEQLMMNLTFRCFAKCGFKPLRTQAFFGVQSADKNLRLLLLELWGKELSNIKERKEIEYVLEMPETKYSSMTSDLEKLPNHKMIAALGDNPLEFPRDSPWYGK